MGAEASYPLQIFAEFRLKGRRKEKNNNLTSAKTIKSLSWDEQLGGSLMFQDLVFSVTGCRSILCYNIKSIARRNNRVAKSRLGILGVCAAFSPRDGSADSCTVSSVQTESIHSNEILHP